MPLGMKVGLSPGDFVFDGNPAPPPQKGSGVPQIFGPCLLWPRWPISATAELLFTCGTLFLLTILRRILHYITVA